MSYKVKVYHDDPDVLKKKLEKYVDIAETICRGETIHESDNEGSDQI